MQFLTVKKQHLPSASYNILFPILLLLCSSTTITEGAGNNVTFPAIIGFGDSILDTGNNNNLITISKSNFPPYGRDFINGQPTGRFTNGKTPTDLIAEGLGIKEIVPAYADPTLQNNDLQTGVCFASGGSGLDPITITLESVFSMGDQFNHFKEYLTKLRGIVGEEKAKEIISKSLVLVSSGNNDIAITYFGTASRVSQYDVSSYSALLVSTASTFIQDLYELGVRKIGVFSALPLGCLPSIRTLHRALLPRECAETINQAAEVFNYKLLSEINDLNRKLSEVRIHYIDVYNPLLDIIKNPSKSGFEVGDRGCCGTGLVELVLLCNEFDPFTCPDASKYIFWDSAHPTQKAYQVLVSGVIDSLKKSLL